MRRLLVAVLAVLVVLLAVDRVSVFVAEGVIADRAQTEGGLPREPQVDITGFPFLTQLLAGRYDQVRLSADGSVAGELGLERLDVRASGVQLPLSQLLGGNVARLPVDGLTADVVVRYDELARRSGRDLVLSAAGDQVRVSGTVKALGATVDAAAVSKVRLDGNRIVLRAQSFELGDGSADAALDVLLGDRFDFSVRVGALPYGLELTGLDVQRDGIHLAARSGPTVLSR